MAWIEISANGEELDRRELKQAQVVGRSGECDIHVRDILLSRTHCRIEPVGQGWRVVDLNSKNGTRVGWQGVRIHVLRDGDHLRMGRTRIVYHTGPFDPAKAKPRRMEKIVRPADPHEALTGTVTDFVLLDEESETFPESYADHPYPQPRPAEPEESPVSVESVQEDVASSFWYRQGEGSSVAEETVTGVVTTALATVERTKVRALPRMLAKPIYREIRQTARTETDLSLQADPIATPVVEAVVESGLSQRQRRLLKAGIVVAGIFSTGVVLMSIWLLTLAA